MLNKLSFKIGLLFFLVILFIESLLFFILYTNLADDRVDEVMNSILARGNTHRDVLEDHYNPATLEHVGTMESASSFIVIITDENGNMVVNSDPIKPEMREIIDASKGKKVPSKGEIIEDRWKQKPYIATESPITINREHKGHVFMFADTGEVKKIVDQLSDQFVVIGMITIGLTIVTVFILSRFITLPLIKMKEATEQLSKGENKLELHTERKDELGELANSITKLSTDLEELKNARNEFLGSISHELRTPLTYMKGYADIISRPDTSEEEKMEYISIIREETNQLSGLVKNLFELAKMDQNKFVINQERVNLCTLIQSVAERMTPVFSEKNIAFTVNCPNKTTAFVDPERFQQVLINVLDNARKHSAANGKIALIVDQTAQTIVLTIADEGEGIPEAELLYLFDRLYRVEKSRSRQSGGSGLGLAIAKEIIESHGGSITAKSKLGEGTSIHITLPKRGGSSEQGIIN